MFSHAITKIVMAITLVMAANTMMTMEVTRNIGDDDNDDTMKHIKPLHVLGFTYSYSNPLVNSNHAPSPPPPLPLPPHRVATVSISLATQTKAVKMPVRTSG